jgi:hypothetical protein
VGLLIPFYNNSAPVNKKFQRLVGSNFIDAQAEVLFTVRIVLQNSGVSDYPNYWVAFPWPEFDRLESQSGAKTSVTITIAKGHLWDNGLVPFEPPIEGRSEGGCPVLQTFPEGHRSRIVSGK